jgi:hypothetical protein
MAGNDNPGRPDLQGHAAASERADPGAQPEPARAPDAVAVESSAG